ncbi:MAG: DNA double-strand break repair nuclease NurA [Nitrososphaerota archaeon]|nr:DNA double-strand break repair nuclease NurA [Nitrososphaerota archaeon]
MGFLAERLRRHTSDLASLLTSRISELRSRPGLTLCIKPLATSNPKPVFFEPGEYVAVGIDGSMDYDELLEMLLFYVCATGFRCEFNIGDRVDFSLDHVRRDERLAASASVPLWTEDLFYVTDESSSTEYDLARTAERIPYAMMTMAELSLALKAIEDDDVRLLFMDRPLHGTFGPLARDFRHWLDRKRSILLGMKTSHGPLTYLDLCLAFVLGSGENWVPKRRGYYPFAAVQKLMQIGRLTAKDLLAELSVPEKSRKYVLRGLLKLHKSSEDGLFTEDFNLEDENSVLELKSHVRNYWLRAREAAWSVVERIFSSNEHPLMLNEGKSWLTVLDLNVINVLLIHMLREEAIRRRVLVIGIAKDTSASDYIRAVIPYARFRGTISMEEKLPNLRHDRAFLTILSSTNPETFSVPWRTISYDSCFATMIEGDGNIVLKAARRRIAVERQFVKGYFQIRQFKSDEAVRSPAFMYDRFYIPEVDEDFTAEITATEGDRETLIQPYWEGEDENPLDSFILQILSKCDNPEVLEAVGHNQLLYLADKAVKNEVKMMRGLLRGVADLELGTLSRKQKIFTIARRFRDIRRETEGARERTLSEGENI